jgi:hypothetical protein
MPTAPTRPPPPPPKPPPRGAGPPPPPQPWEDFQAKPLSPGAV